MDMVSGVKRMMYWGGEWCQGVMYGYGEWCQKDDILGVVSGAKGMMHGYGECYQVSDV